MRTNDFWFYIHNCIQNAITLPFKHIKKDGEETKQQRLLQIILDRGKRTINDLNTGKNWGEIEEKTLNDGQYIKFGYHYVKLSEITIGSKVQISKEHSTTCTGRIKKTSAYITFPS